MCPIHPNVPSAPAQALQWEWECSAQEQGTASSNRARRGWLGGVSTKQYLGNALSPPVSLSPPLCPGQTLLHEWGALPGSKAGWLWACH